MYAPHLYPCLCWWEFRLFPILAIVDGAAGNSGQRVPFGIMVFSVCVLHGRVAGSHGSSVLVLQGPPHHSPQWGHLFTVPPTAQEGSVFSAPSPVFTLRRYFDDGHLVQWEWCLIL